MDLLKNKKLVAVIGDTHLGRSLYGLDLTPYIRRAMYEFLDLCIAKDIGFAIHLGDLFDRSAPTVEQIKTSLQWCNEFERRRINLCILVGNHDATNKPMAPSAIEPTRIAPFDYVQVIDRPMSLRWGGCPLALCPFPSPGIYGSPVDYVTELEGTVKPGAVTFTHLHVDGATVGEEAIVCRAQDHVLPRSIVNRASLIVGGHVHKPQAVGRKIALVGAVERLRFDERHDPRYFLTIDTDTRKLTHYVRGDALKLLQVTIDATVETSLPRGNGPLTTAHAIQLLLEKEPKGCVVKLLPYVDHQTCVDWHAVEDALYKAGALRVFTSPDVKAERVRKAGPLLALQDHRAAAKKFIWSRVRDKVERSELLKMFDATMAQC